MPKLDLDPWRTLITRWIVDAGSEYDEVLELLKEQGVEIGVSTLKRRLQEWGVSRMPDTELVNARITELFFRYRKTDNAIAAMLAVDGFKRISGRYVKDVRKKLGLRKRLERIEAEELEGLLRQLLTAEYDAGHIEDFGKDHLYTYLRQKYTNLNIIGRNRVYRIATALNPLAHQRRQRRSRKRRPPATYPGPNYMWCMDAHCKLEKYGIQIYASIDTWSRKITWLYVGITARIAVSVAAQYI
ncbi:hypothetical protein KCU65_g2882, partial [Aureobasidium melanogenum]